MLTFDLKFHSASCTPTVKGDYLLYNQDHGYIPTKANFEDGEFLGFFWPSGRMVGVDFYCAWTLLPDSAKTMYSAFAKKDHEPAAAPQPE